MTRFVFYQKLSGSHEGVKGKREVLLQWSVLYFCSWRQKGGSWGGPTGSQFFRLSTR